MNNLDEIKRIISQYKPELQQRFGVREIAIFGSCVRSEQAPGSDIDILVDFDKPIGFFAFLDLEERLRDLLRAKIDLVSRKALKPRIGARILQEAVAI